jgi:hypothetical protein
METEIIGHLPFLNIDIYPKTDCSFSHTVYKNSTPITPVWM